MSFYKQMVIFITLCILAVSGIIMLSVLEYDKTLIENQLHENAKNSANLLGLTISKNIDLNDTATLSGMLDAVLDNGFYRSILIVDEDNKVLVSALHEQSVKAPSWFTSFMSTKNLQANADIMQGWLNKGEVRVSVDNNFALNSLWDAFKSIVYIFLTCTILSLVLLYILLRFLLKPLKKLDLQAQAVEENRFIIVKEKSATLEFASVTHAMNKSIKKLQGIFAKEIDIFRKYNRLLYTDEELRIGNRKFMMLKLEKYLKHSFGSLIFIEIKDRAKVKNALGYIRFSSLNTLIIDSCDDIFGKNKDFIVAKLNEETLGVLLPYEELEDVKSSVEEFYLSINKYINHTKLNAEYDIQIAIGATDYSEKEYMSGVLTKADESLKQAGKKEKMVNYSNFAKSLKQKNESLMRCVKNDEINIEFDILNVYDNATKQNIISEYIPNISISDEKTRYSKELVMGLSSHEIKIALQKSILEEFFMNIEKTKKLQDISIKLSHEFATDKKSVKWLLNTLSSRFQSGAPKIYFECLNVDILAKKHDYEHLVKGLKNANHGFMVESYAFENNNFEYLKVLQPTYIKISKAYILHDLSNISKDVLENIATALGSKLVVKNVDNEDDLLKLESLNVEYLQGRCAR